jgi:hypothetical protein
VIVNGKQYGELVPGTYLEFLGRAPRRSSTDRQAQAWYFCTACQKSIVMIRRQDVKPHRTVSCGCIGKRQFAERHEQIVAKIAPATRKAVFEAAYARGARRQYRHELADRFNLESKYVVDFLVARHQQFILAAAKLGKQVLSLLSKIERRWLPRYQTYCQIRDAQAAREAMLDAMNWRDRVAFLAEERRRQHDAWDQIKDSGLSFAEWVLDQVNDPSMEPTFFFQ